MTNLTVNNVSYAIDRAGTGTPIVLLHGFTGSKSNWEFLTSKFATEHTIIAPDILGHGNSDSPDDPSRYRMEFVANDIVKLIRSMTSAKVTLVGYSMGGRLALYIALNYPELLHTLVLESASPGLREGVKRAERRERDNALAEKIEHDGIPNFVDFWQDIPLFDSQKNLTHNLRQRLREQRLRNNTVGLANSLRGMGTGVQPALWDQLSRLMIPTLLITGAYDNKFVRIAREMVNHMPNAKHVTIPEAGHTVHLEAPDQFVSHVRQFTEEAITPSE